LTPSCPVIVSVPPLEIEIVPPVEVVALSRFCGLPKCERVS
jgi:hypothetical protein